MRIFDLLIEATDYGQMFNDVFKLSNNDPKVREQVGQNIEWARQYLKKNDWIIWYLRWFKVFLASQLGRNRLPGGLAPEQIDNVIGVGAYNRRYKTNYTSPNLYVSSNELKTRLLHYLGTPVPEIQNFVFTTQSPEEVMTAFKGWEELWRKRMEQERSLIKPLDEDEIVLEFPDGYAWWLLPRGGCDIEAKAMGHCGNVPTQRSGERILSLRRRVTRGDEERWYPVATFIIDGDGMLGEMKGRNNDKPIAKYHPYIVALLRHDMIEGIRGGGYMPENNFSLNDIDQQTREELFQEKPGLRGLLDFYESEGMTERVLEMLRSKMYELNLPMYDEYDAENKVFTLDSYQSLERFAKDNGDDVIEKLLEYREKVEDAQADSGSIRLNANLLLDFLDELPDDIFHQIAASFGIDSTDGDSERAVAKMLERNRGPIFDQIEEAFIQAGDYSDLLKDLNDRLGEYAEAGWAFDADRVYMVMEDPEHPWATQIFIKIAEIDLVYMCTARDDEYDSDEYSYDAVKVAHNGSWDDVNWDYTNEYRQNNGLLKRSHNSREYVDNEFGDEYNRDFTIEDLSGHAAVVFTNGRSKGGRSSPKIHDPRQLSMKFEAKLTELRRRAGIRI